MDIFVRSAIPQRTIAADNSLQCLIPQLFVWSSNSYHQLAALCAAFFVPTGLHLRLVQRINKSKAPAYGRRRFRFVYSINFTYMHIQTYTINSKYTLSHTDLCY